MIRQSFYDNVVIFEKAFEERDFKLECDFLEWCFEKHAKIKKSDKVNKSFLEIDCGPAKHASLMEDRDWKCIGLDGSREMIDYAKAKATEEGLKLKFVKADKRNFKLKKPVHLAVSLFESITDILKNEEMILHLKSLAKNLAKGGLYIIEFGHPRYFFPDEQPETLTTEKLGKKYEVTVDTPVDKYNSITQQWLTTVVIKITDENGNESFEEDLFFTRKYLFQELKMLVELSKAFSKVWIYDSLYSIPGKVLSNKPESEAMILVLRK